MSGERFKVAAISGSLRAGSSNTAVLHAARELAPPTLDVVLFEGIGELPHFNPDLDGEGAEPPAPVKRFRAVLAEADGVIICSPEYAHGVPGALKDALDWIVSSGELMDKPVVLINAAPAGGEWAQAALLETLTIMSAQVLREASLVAPFIRRRGGARELLADVQAAHALKGSLQALAAAILARPRA